MKNFEQIKKQLNNIEEKVDDNCKGTMTPFRARNIVKGLDKIHQNSNSLEELQKKTYNLK